MKLNVDRKMWELWQEECVERLTNGGELNTVAQKILDKHDYISTSFQCASKIQG